MTIPRRLCLPAVVAAILLTGLGQMGADVTNDVSFLQGLVRAYTPDCRLGTDMAGKPQMLTSRSGDTLDLAAAAHETPMPTNTVIGYWFSSSMDFLARQKLQANTAEQAVGIVQLLHALSHRDPTFVQQKIYQARRFDHGWVVQVEHDFTNYPGNIMHLPPYELLLDASHKVMQLRERCYDYPGSATAYTNTVSTVYKREIKKNGGRDYPENLFQELQGAWEKEKRQTTSKKKS